MYSLFRKLLENVLHKKEVKTKTKNGGKKKTGRYSTGDR